jgi:hypothetical protein
MKCNTGGERYNNVYNDTCHYTLDGLVFNSLKLRTFSPSTKKPRSVPGMALENSLAAHPHVGSTFIGRGERHRAGGIATQRTKTATYLHEDSPN